MIAENFIDEPVVKVKGKPGRKPRVVEPPVDDKNPANASFNPGEVKKTEPKVESKFGGVVLKNPSGAIVDSKDYFYSSKGEDKSPKYFHQVCGYPVDREDMLAVFNKIFKPKDGLLFYKKKDQEVYLVIVPIKHSSIVGPGHDSADGDFQKHAISFINEGSVNLDTLKMKLARVASTIHIAE